jgi:molecular chaperone DnaK
MGRIVGIDLGTTNSVLAVMDGDVPRVVPIDGARTVPSVVAFSPDGGVLVGHAAKNQAVLNPTRTVRSAKRLIGRRRGEVADEEASLTYPLVGEPNDVVRLQVGDRALTPSQVSAEVLRYIKRQGETALDDEITDAVITVPAYFNDSQRHATKAAGRIAGLTVRRIVNEPTASALAYGLNDPTLDKRIAVFDLGGGTFDISILLVKNGVFEVLTTNGNTRLGGDDFDNRILAWALDQIRTTYGVDSVTEPSALQRLREAAEAAKCRLSYEPATNIELPFFRPNAHVSAINVRLTLTRQRLEALIADLVQATTLPCEQALRDARLDASRVDDVILVGGSTRIPFVRRHVAGVFGREPNVSVNPDEAVALGAAIQAGILERAVENVLLLDVTPLSLGIETYGGVMTVLIPRNTTIPTSRSELFSTFVDNQTTVDIHVLQGERELAADNRTLARFQLTGVPPMPKGVPQIDVAFDVDANGILNVRAQERRSHREMSVRVASTGEISEEEVNRLIQESLAFAETDVKTRMLVEARVEAQNILSSTRKALDGYGYLLTTDERANVERAAAEMERALATEDTEQIRAATTTLDKATQRLAEVMVTEVVRQEFGTKDASAPEGFGFVTETGEDTNITKDERG